MINIKTEGFDSRVLDDFIKQTKAQIEKVIEPKQKEIAEDILKEAKQNCPVDTGKLKNSGFVKKVDGGYTVGFSEDYALIVHEQPQSYRENGERHFLSNAVEKIAGKDGEKIKELIEK